MIKFTLCTYWAATLAWLGTHIASVHAATPQVVNCIKRIRREQHTFPNIQQRLSMPMRNDPVASEYLEPERMRKAVLHSILHLSNPLLPGCRAFVELPVFSEPVVDPRRGSTIHQSVKAGFIALAKMSVATVGVSIAMVPWGNVIKAMTRDAAYWSKQDAMLEEPVLCLDTLQTTWSDLLDQRGGERRVTVQDMQQLVQCLPVVPLARGDWWARWSLSANESRWFKTD